MCNACRTRSCRGLASLTPLAIVFAMAGCGPAFQPKQAQFRIGPCGDLNSAFETTSLEWSVHPEPVLQRGSASEWDAVDVLNPSIVQAGDRLYNFYSGFDGKTWHTGVATSPDGLSWTKSGRILSPDTQSWEGDYIAANGTAFHDGVRFLYWYQAGGRGAHQIGLASSSDAVTWSKHSGPVLERGARGTWDEAAVGDPYLIHCGGVYYLFYLGQNDKGLQRLGLARSADGIHWQKSAHNPILDVGPAGSFDENGLGEPAVFYQGRFYMLYAGRDANEYRRVGWAQSENGVDWEKITGAALLEGSAEWNRAVICDPSVARLDQRWWVWFGGGSLPSPDENLEGAIGVAWVDTAAPPAAK